MKKEGARSAGRVQHALGQWSGQRMRDDLGCQPIRCVILAQIVALRRVDQAFVKRLQDIRFDIAQAKARRLPGDSAHQILAVRKLQDPIEEIALDRPLDTDLVEGLAGKNRSGVVGRQVEHPRRDRFGNHGQVGVLEKKRIVADRDAIGFAQQSIP
jgi:hypothetical protein